MVTARARALPEPQPPHQAHAPSRPSLLRVMLTADTVYRAVMTSNAGAMPTAWRGHCWFALWLVNRLQPSVTVDLGVDYGYSTFCFAAPGYGTVYAVDVFTSGQQGKREEDHFAQVVKRQQNLRRDICINNVQLMRGTFATASETFKTWQWSIDLLHIDGLHTAAAVKEDYETWHGYLRKDGPWVVLFHDIGSFSDVRSYFQSLDGHKFMFKHSAGLGVLASSKALLEEIRSFASMAHFRTDKFTFDITFTGHLRTDSPAMAIGLENRSLAFARCD